MRNLEKGQHIFIAFQDGKAVLDSQLRPRIYTSLENADKWTPTVNKGKIEYVEYAPTLTPPNEALTLEKLENMEDTTPVWWDQINSWVLVYKGNLTTWSGKHLYAKGCNGKFYRRPPEGEEETE